MLSYLKDVAIKATGVFVTTLLGAITAESALSVGVNDLGSAFEVSAAAALATVVWPAASRLAARAAAHKVSDPPPLF